MEEKLEYTSQQSLSDREIAEKVITNYHAAVDATQTWRKDKWPKYFDMYMQKHDTDNARQYRSKIYVPIAFSQIRVIAPYLMQTIFNSDPVFKLNDVTGTKENERKAIEKLIQRQVDAMGLYEKMYSFILNMLIYGTAVAKVYWDEDIREKEVMKKTKKVRYKEFAGIKLPYLAEVEEPGIEEDVRFYGPQMANIDIVDFYIDPKATQLDGYWKGHIVYKTVEQLKAANRKSEDRLYKNLKDLEVAILARSAEAEEERQKAERKQVNDNHVDIERVPDGKIRLLEYWYPDDSKFCLVALDYGIVVRESENVFDHGMSPFISAVFQPIPGEFYGMGVPQIVYGLQKNVNTITNQRNDNINLIINRMWKYKKDSGVNPATLKSVPGGLVGCDDMDDVQPFEMPDVTQSAYIEVQNNKTEAQEALGTKHLSGANPTGSNKTATGVRLNQNAEAQSVMGIFKLLESTALFKMVDMFYQLNMQFNTREDVVEVIGEKGQHIDFTVKPEQFAKYRTFYCAGITSVMQRDTQVHQMTNFLAIIGRIPPEQVMAYGINVPKILKKIWESMGLDDSDEIIGGDQQAVAQQAAQFGMMNQMGQATGSGIADALTQPTPANTLSSGNQAGGQQGAKV